MMKTSVKGFVIAGLVLLGVVSQVKAGDKVRDRKFQRVKTLEVSVTNLTSNILLTAPILATSRRPIPFYSLTQPASDALERLAEGGDTSGLETDFRSDGAQDVFVGMPPADVIPAGMTKTFMIEGRFGSLLHMASMLLPTNDGFVALNGIRVWHLLKEPFYLNAYDAGTELNDESCDNIPGPQGVCAGEGYNGMDFGEGWVTPHPGIHGEGEDLAAGEYNWGEPVAKISVKVKK
jgi:hypothetical protein